MGCEWVASLANQLARRRVEAQVHDVGPRWESRLVLHDARARDRAHLCMCMQMQLRCGPCCGAHHAHAVHTSTAESVVAAVSTPSSSGPSLAIPSKGQYCSA